MKSKIVVATVEHTIDIEDMNLTVDNVPQKTAVIVLDKVLNFSWKQAKADYIALVVGVLLFGIGLYFGLFFAAGFVAAMTLNNLLQFGEDVDVYVDIRSEEFKEE